MKNTKIFLLIMAFAVMTTFALVGCSSQSSKIEKEDKKLETLTEADSQYPMTIKHAFGETVIESKPERVATIRGETMMWP